MKGMKCMNDLFSNNNHLIKTTHEWISTSMKSMIIPMGCLCVELTDDGNTRIKIGEGNKYFEQLPYVDTDIDIDEIISIIEDYLKNYATQEEIEVITNEINSINKTTDELDKQIKNVDEEILNAKESINDLDNRIESDESNISDLDAAVDDIEKTMSSYNDRIDSLELDKHTHKNKSILDNTSASYTTQEKNKLSHIEDNANDYELPPATRTELGGIIVGNNLEITTDGVLSATGGGIPYELPPATRTELGGIIVGNNLEITSSGVLSATGGGGSYVLPIATDRTLGGVIINGNNLSIDPSTGLLSAIDTVYTLPKATDQILGGIKIGSRLTIDSSTGVLSADDQSYTLPKATDTSLGGVKIDGNNLSIDSNGVLHATDTNTEYDAGTGIRIDTPVSGNDEIVNTGVLNVTKNSSNELVISKESGDTIISLPSEYSLPIATTSTLGGIVVGNNLTINTTTGVLDANGITITDIGADEILAMWNGT